METQNTEIDLTSILQSFIGHDMMTVQELVFDMRHDILTAFLNPDAVDPEYVYAGIYEKANEYKNADGVQLVSTHDHLKDVTLTYRGQDYLSAFDHVFAEEGVEAHIRLTDEEARIEFLRLHEEEGPEFLYQCAEQAATQPDVPYVSAYKDDNDITIPLFRGAVNGTRFLTLLQELETEGKL